MNRKGAPGRRGKSYALYKDAAICINNTVHSQCNCVDDARCLCSLTV
jgi:hypothetical protein